MKHPARLFALPVLLLALDLLTGCESLPLESFSGRQPRFAPEKFFAGRTHSWGVFEDLSGNPKKRFVTDAIGHLQGDTLMLHQKFTYENGEVQERSWKIRRIDEHHYEGTANDVVGKATGVTYGNAFYFEYTVALKPGNPLFHVRLKQWMYLQDGGSTMVNRATVSKLGVKLAMVTEYFTRGTPPEK